MSFWNIEWKVSGYWFSVEKIKENYLLIFKGNNDSYEFEVKLTPDEEWEDLSYTAELILPNNIKDKLDEESTYWFWDDEKSAFNMLANNVSGIILAFESGYKIYNEVSDFIKNSIQEEDPRAEVDDLVNEGAESIGEILEKEEGRDDKTWDLFDWIN